MPTTRWLPPGTRDASVHSPAPIKSVVRIPWIVTRTVSEYRRTAAGDGAGSGVVGITSPPAEPVTDSCVGVPCTQAVPSKSSRFSAFQ